MSTADPSAFSPDPIENPSVGPRSRSADTKPKTIPNEQEADQESIADDPKPAFIPRQPNDLVQFHQRGIWRYLRMLGCDENTAEDLTQETFLKVLRQSNFVQHSDAATASYLRRTAHNLLVSMHRKEGRVRVVGSAEILDIRRHIGRRLHIQGFPNCVVQQTFFG
ncbi:MAG: sigma factor, partial [Planctomycetota bacterium]